jgi:glucose-6-phosphate isomerase
MVPENLIQRIWDKDTSLWTSDPEVAATIDNRLGWIDGIAKFEHKLVAIRAFVDHLPYSNVVLLGMGGSSLVSNVFAQAMPDKTRTFYMLDTTDPETIQSVAQKIPLDNTLFIVASKSGTTIEVDCLFDYFYGLVPNPQQFIAITDFNTPLMHKAKEMNFRHIFINPTDIGGRFAALSYFGLIPFALMGGDVISFVETAKKFVETCKKTDNNPPLKLAQQMFEHTQAGRNKMYFNISKKYSALTQWIEQLVAESTGKHGKGIIPILSGKPGHDGFTVDIDVRTPHDLAHEFFNWKMATAMVGAMMEINPFDEPNVVSSKKNTGSYLQSANAPAEIKNKISGLSKSAFEIPAFLKGITSPEMIFVLSYLPSTEQIQKFASQATVPVSICTGPSYLHSTGQLHKGGPNQGRFVIVVDSQDDLPIPNRNYGFQTLKLAQALGDYEALVQAGRKVMMVKV